MRLSQTIALGALLWTAQLCAGYVDKEVLFKEDFESPDALKSWNDSSSAVFEAEVGPDGSNAVKFSSEGTPKTRWMNISLDPAKVSGLIRLEAYVKGEGLEIAKKPYWGPKLMINYVDAKGKDSWPEAPKRLGTYDWIKAEKVVQLPADPRKIVLMIGLQEGLGAYHVAKIRIYRCVEGEDQDRKASVNKEAEAIPRGDFKGAKFRGVMSGAHLEDADFATLKEWGVNLMRYQMNMRGGKVDISTSEKYLAWIDAEIAGLDEVLPLARKYGVKIAIDLHKGPGTKVNEVASNVLVDGNLALDTLTEAWRRIAKHYKGNSDIYGYDLLNEPVVDGYVKGKGNPWQFIADTVSKAIREVDPETPIIVEPDFEHFQPVPVKNVIYSPHFYSPHSFTHQLVLQNVRWSYPGWIDGVYWDKEQLRLSLKPVIEFQRKYKVPIFVGEFSAAIWAKGADKYLADSIAIFEEYGWDWTYHAFREWPGWSVEHEGESRNVIRASADNPRKKVLLEGFKLNAKSASN